MSDSLTDEDVYSEHRNGHNAINDLQRTFQSVLRSLSTRVAAQDPPILHFCSSAGDSRQDIAGSTPDVCLAQSVLSVLGSNCDAVCVSQVVFPTIPYKHC